MKVQGTLHTSIIPNSDASGQKSIAQNLRSSTSLALLGLIYQAFILSAAPWLGAAATSITGALVLAGFPSLDDNDSGEKDYFGTHRVPYSE